MPGARIASGDRVVLRTLESEDRPFVQRSYANPDLRYPLGSPVKTEAQLEDWIDDEDSDNLLVCLDGPDAGPGQPGDDTDPIGLVTVSGMSWRRPELVYWIVPEAQRDGYGAEAVSLAIDYTFRAYDHPAIGAGAYAHNDASRGLLESLGFEEEGRHQKYRFVDGEYIDTVLYVLFREDWWADGDG